MSNLQSKHPLRPEERVCFESVERVATKDREVILPGALRPVGEVYVKNGDSCRVLISSNETMALVWTPGKAFLLVTEYQVIVLNHSEQGPSGGIIGMGFDHDKPNTFLIADATTVYVFCHPFTPACQIVPQDSAALAPA